MLRHLSQDGSVGTRVENEDFLPAIRDAPTLQVLFL